VALLAAGAVALAQASGPQPPGGGVALPPDEQCTEEIRANPRWICLTSATLDDQGRLVVEYEAEWGGELPDKSTGFHMHLYGGDGTDPPAETMGNQAAEPGAWYIEDADPAVIPTSQVRTVIGNAPKVCARISDRTHQLVPDLAGGFATGNCIPISRR
jgi:molecular chaperone DnaK